MITKNTSGISFSVLILFLVAGCGDKSGQDDKNQQSSSKVPKLSFHQPKDLKTAVSRIQEIHAGVIGEGVLPDPVKFDYVEVIHGEGASGHSHYFLASEFKESDDGHGHHFDEDHGEMKETIKRGVYEVDVRTELKDLIGWLPGTAAMTDLEESDWNTVNDVSKKLSRIVNSIPDSADDAEFRQTWKGHVDELSEMFGQLSTIAGKSEGENF